MGLESLTLTVARDSHMTRSAHVTIAGASLGFSGSGNCSRCLLYLLASRGGQVVTREAILDAVWGPDFVAESNIVDRHVRSLRITLQNDYRDLRFIETVPGQGYRFIPTFSNAGWASNGIEGHRPS